MIARRAFALVFAAALAASQAAADTSEYTVTIKEVLLKNVTGQWVSVIRPDKQVDLVESEAQVSFFNNDGRIPEGGYINFRVVLSETVRVAGRDKKIYVTRAEGEARLTGTAEKHADLPGEITAFVETAPTLASEGEPGPVRLHLDLDEGDADDVMTVYGKRDFPEPIQVSKGSFIKIWFDVELEDAVRFAWPGAFGDKVPARDVMYALPPSRIEELTLKVDERVETLNPEAIVLEF